MNDKVRLRWGCRRGMLELDLLLLPFFEKEFEHLSLEEKHIFPEFLEESDQDLYAWILNFQKCTEPKFQSLLKKIRSHHAIH